MRIKAAILAAGKGSRLCPLTPFLPKEMLPIGGFPAIHHVVKEVVAVGINELMVILSEGKESVRDYFTKSLLVKGNTAHGLSRERDELLSSVKVRFAYQKKLLGTADAIYTARDFAGSDPLLVLYPDDLLSWKGEGQSAKTLAALCSLACAEGVSSLMLREVPREDASNYGIVDLMNKKINGFPYIRNIVEKPIEYKKKHAYAMIGRMILCTKLLDLIPVLPLNDHDGIIPALNQEAKAERLIGAVYNGPHYDIGSHEGYLHAVRSFE